MLNISKCNYAKERLLSVKGIKKRFEADFFNEFSIELPVPAIDIIKELEKDKILAGIPASNWYPDEKNTLIISITEMNSTDGIENFVQKIQKLL